MIEEVHKEFITLSVNKYGEVVERKKSPIDFKIEYEELNPMMQDLVKILKDKSMNAIALTYVDSSGFVPKIEKEVFRLEHVKKVIIKEYYICINRRKFFFNAIFDFYGIDR